MIVERQILARLRHSKFFSLYELNQAILELLEDLNNQRFQIRDGSRKEVFETVDKPAMRPLPTTGYEYAEWKRLKVQMNYHVRIENGYYSVPYDMVGQKLDVRITRNTVEIFSDGMRVASHQRCERDGQYKTVIEHMPSSHQAHASWTPARILKWAETIGPATQAVCEAIMAAGSIQNGASSSAAGFSTWHQRSIHQSVLRQPVKEQLQFKARLIEVLCRS